MDDETRDLLGELANRPLKDRIAGATKRKDPKPRGYAWTPGTGPAGETCGTCFYLHRRALARNYLKCSKNRQCWTGGRASDILSRSPACKHWEKKKPETS